jgi:ribosomal protein S4
LDVLVYRLQFSNSLSQSRDFIRKGFISINSKPMTFSGYFVPNGSLISCSHLSSVFNRISHRKHSLSMPHFLFHTSYLSGILLYNPYSITPFTESPSFPHFKYFNATFRPASSSRPALL